MNYLAHYYFDHHKDDAYFNLGLIFPDIIRNIVKGTKLNLNMEETLPDNEQSLLRGCIQHVQSDKVFHAWEEFHKAMEFVTHRIRESRHDIRRDWFIAHILVELVMDHYLIHKQPDLATNLYTDLESVDTETLVAFLARHDFCNFDRFREGFDRFLKFRYLETYGESDNIVYALGQISTKMRLDPFTDKQKDLLKDIVLELTTQMPAYIGQLEDELK